MIGSEAACAVLGLVPTLHEACEKAGQLVRLAGAGKDVRVFLDERDEAKAAAAEAAPAAKRNASRGSQSIMFGSGAQGSDAAADEVGLSRAVYVVWCLGWVG